MTKAEAIAEYKAIYSSSHSPEEFEKQRARIDELKNMLDGDELIELAMWHMNRLFGLGASEDASIPSTQDAIIEEYKGYFGDTVSPKSVRVRERLAVLREYITADNLVKLDQWHYNESHKLLTTKFGKTPAEADKILSKFSLFSVKDSN